MAEFIDIFIVSVAVLLSIIYMYKKAKKAMVRNQKSVCAGCSSASCKPKDSKNCNTSVNVSFFK